MGRRNLRAWLKRELFHSMSLRFALVLAACLILVFAALGLGIQWMLTANLFEQRRQVILEDASLRFTQMQDSLDQATASTPDQMQAAVSELLQVTRESASSAGAVAVMLYRSPTASTSFRINEYSTAGMENVVTDEIREAVAEGGGYWQSVSFTGEQGQAPGIVVGAQVGIPQAGIYEVFFLYSLEADQETVDLVVKVTVAWLIPLVVIASVAMLVVTYRALSPLRSLAKAADAVAQGSLETRVEVKGQDEMAVLGRAFNQMAQSLQHQIDQYAVLSKVQQQFVSDVSHELRTPLTTIRMAEDVIYDARDQLDPSARRSAELLDSEVQRLQEMLADLLEISRYDANAASLDAETVDAAELVRKQVEANRELAEHLGVQVEVEAHPQLRTVEADPKRLDRVVRNLLVNAYEYAERGRVQVTLASTDRALAIRVRDWGMGMSVDTIEHVFDRFFRADVSRTRTTGGTGLGLSIVKEDVQLHGGIVEAYGELTKGSSFLVTLPLSPEQPLKFSKGDEELCDRPLPLWEEDA